MVKKTKTKQHPLFDGLIKAMHSLDQQVAREMQRSPEERAEHGVQKWAPYESRVENVSSLVLNALADSRVELDSLIILSRVFCKVLFLWMDELEEKGLGDVRGSYCRDAVEKILFDMTRAKEIFPDQPSVS